MSDEGRGLSGAFSLDLSLVLYEDEDLLVLDKPAGISSQAADPEHPDDIVTCVRALLEARDGVAPSLGVHQRLDRDTSGVMVLARSARANASLARQFESRSIEKAYVACVHGGPREPCTLVHRLGERTKGRVEVVSGAEGREATTRVVPLEREGDRALLGLRIETGRTHQIRVQLSESGYPIAGDVAYGGPVAPRLMLHAASLTLRHPADDRVLALKAKVPRSFKRFLLGEDAYRFDDERSLAEALAGARVSRAFAFAARRDDRATNVFRLLHGEGDGVPGLQVDVYDEHLVVELMSEPALASEAAILDALYALGPRGVYVKRRPKKASDLVSTRRDAIAPSAPSRGSAAPDPMRVVEHGVPYLVRLGDGLATGLYLDQRENRRRVIAWAEGRRVLNLFAYACAFSMAAAWGRARSVTSVDASSVALDRGAEAYDALGLDVPHEHVHADVFTTLSKLADAGRRFDLVICDPPTYATTRASRFTSGEDWRALVALACPLLEEGGILLATSNDRRMRAARFRKLVEEGARDVSVARLRSYAPPKDFPPDAAGEHHLKTVVLERG